MESHKRILIVDDDELVRTTVQRALHRAGYDTDLAKDAAEAIGKVKRERYDLILSDIRMPGKNGVETMGEVRDFYARNGVKDIPIIFITGYAEMGLELIAEQHGEGIPKPFDLDRLLITIREYL